ncbi:MAG: SGNH/GDSL hydrolase family protein [Acidobacteriota bacterium]
MAGRPPRRRWVSAYQSLALMLLNVSLLLLLINACAAGVLAVSGDDSEGALAYGLDALRPVYPDRDDAEIERLLRETWSRQYTYEPYTQFKEGPFKGEFVNISERGFRSTGVDLPWPPAVGEGVFVFGGSTTFGYGLSDDETIPAQLGAVLAERCGASVPPVYNLGRSNYFSSQENILFQRLVAEGIRPRAAVFVDGLNEFGHADDAPKFTGRLAYAMRETTGQQVRRLAVNMPMARLAKRWLQRPEQVQERVVETGDAQAVLDRWLRNRRQIQAVAAAEGVETLFVWQPVPGFGYDLEHHSFAGAGGPERATRALGYEAMDRLREAPDGPLAEDFLWLGDLQRNRGEALYVDQVHYTAAFSQNIAERLAESLVPRLCAEESSDAADL